MCSSSWASIRASSGDAYALSLRAQASTPLSVSKYFESIRYGFSVIAILLALIIGGIMGGLYSFASLVLGGRSVVLCRLPGLQCFEDQDLDHIVPGPVFVLGKFVNFFEDCGFKPNADLFFAHKQIIGKNKKRLNVIDCT